jgi:hypothetical protein
MLPHPLQKQGLLELTMPFELTGFQEFQSLGIIK